MKARIITGDALAVLRSLPEGIAPTYAELTEKRIGAVAPLFAAVTAESHSALEGLGEGQS